MADRLRLRPSVVHESTEINMSKSRKLSGVFAAIVAVSMMTTTSAFADSRHRNETRDEQFRSRSDDRRGTSNYGYRNDTRRSQQTFQGRVNRVEHNRGGYNVWIGGGRYPFFIEGSRCSRFASASTSAWAATGTRPVTTMSMTSARTRRRAISTAWSKASTIAEERW